MSKLFLFFTVWPEGFGKKARPKTTAKGMVFCYKIVLTYCEKKIVLKYGSEEKGSSLYRCSILLGFIMSKKQERLRSELLSEDKITNLLGFLT